MTWWNRNGGINSFPGDKTESEIVKEGSQGILAEAKKKFKTKTELLHQTKINIKGNEPFLSFQKSHLIVNLSAGLAGSHTFFEGGVDQLRSANKGDVLAVQIVRIHQVPMTWWGRLRDGWTR